MIRLANLLPIAYVTVRLRLGSLTLTATGPESRNVTLVIT